MNATLWLFLNECAQLAHSAIMIAPGKAGPRWQKLRADRHLPFHSCGSHMLIAHIGGARKRERGYTCRLEPAITDLSQIESRNMEESTPKAIYSL